MKLKYLVADIIRNDDITIHRTFLHIHRIYVEDLLAIGAEKGNAELHPCKHSIVNGEQNFCGEIEVGATFTRKVFVFHLKKTYDSHLLRMYVCKLLQANVIVFLNPILLLS